MRVEYTFLRGWAKNPEVDWVSPVVLQKAAEWPRTAHPGPLTRLLSGRPPGATRPQVMDSTELRIFRKNGMQNIDS